MIIPRICSQCATRFDDQSPAWRCTCGGPLDLTWRGALIPDRLAGREATLWRYREALPPIDTPVTLGEGFTPLLPFRLEGRDVLLKCEHLFPTGSYKDRGAALLVSHARDTGITEVIEDSSGNAGAAMAAYCARAGIRCRILVPESTSSIKKSQITAFGAELIEVPGPREAAAEKARSLAEHTFYASHCYNPWFLQGTKTFAYEIWEQLGHRVPDTVILPVGNGTLLLGADLGFDELFEWGLANRRPRLVGVQAARCAPLVEAFRDGLDEPVDAVRDVRPTRAEGIAVAAPVRGRQILAAIRESGGTLLAVKEESIESCRIALGRAGILAEPTAAAGLAGAARYFADAPPDEEVLAAVTGHGLKTVASNR